MVRIALLLMVLALVPVEATARGVPWRQHRVMVYDHTGPEWSPYVQDAVNRYNGMLPKRAPTLVYVPMSGPCRGHKRAIVFCIVPLADLPAGNQAWTHAQSQAGEMLEALVRIDETVSPGLENPCHEMMHALGWWRHGAWVDVRPCPYSANAMRDLYKRDRKHR